MKGMRKEWENLNYLVIVDCNDGRWVYGASNCLQCAWQWAELYNGYVLIND